MIRKDEIKKMYHRIIAIIIEITIFISKIRKPNDNMMDMTKDTFPIFIKTMGAIL